VGFKSVSIRRQSEEFLQEGLDSGIARVPVGQIRPDPKQIDPFRYLFLAFC
jgi:hypothetical protein